MNRRDFLKSIGAALVLPGALGALRMLPQIEAAATITIPAVQPGGFIAFLAENSIEMGDTVYYTGRNTVRSGSLSHTVPSENILMGFATQAAKKGKSVIVKWLGEWYFEFEVKE